MKPTDDRPRWPEWLETWVFPFMWEPLLWPVWVAILGHVVLIFALAILDVFRGTGFLAALVSLTLTFGLVGWELRLFGRPGAVFLSLVGTWLVAAGVIALALRTGFL